MFSTFHTILSILILSAFYANLISAQPRKGEYIDVSVGYGISAPYDDVDIYGSGFYAQGEYVFGITRWFGVRPYAGFILTSADENTSTLNFSVYKVTANAFLFGSKIRVSAPIPWVAPYFEAGLGASIGSFKTFTPYTDIEKNGLLLHIPFTIGLSIGRKHNFDFEFTYYFHPSVSQFAGAAAVGFSFPLK